jgi:hypothetical protein
VTLPTAWTTRGGGGHDLYDAARSCGPSQGFAVGFSSLAQGGIPVAAKRLTAFLPAVGPHSSRQSRRSRVRSRFPPPEVVPTPGQVRESHLVSRVAFWWPEGFMSHGGNASARTEDPVSGPPGPHLFEAFVEAQHTRLFRALYLVTGNRQEAEEIIQDAFVAVWERWDRVPLMDDPTGYLFRTAMNVFRKRSRRPCWPCGGPLLSQPGRTPTKQSTAVRWSSRRSRPFVRRNGLRSCSPLSRATPLTRRPYCSGRAQARCASSPLEDASR